MNLEPDKIEYKMECGIQIPLPSHDLKNRYPIGRCDTPSLFSLTDKTADTPSQKKGDSIVEIASTTQEKIDQIELEIFELRQKAAHYDDLLKTLRAIAE